MIFHATPPLKQQQAVAIDEENRERPVQQAFLVDGPLLGATDGTIALIHEDQIIGHELRRLPR